MGLPLEIKTKKYSRVVFMGDPRHFTIRKGANPHTRNRWGFKKRVNRERAILQWKAMAQTLQKFGVKIYVIPPHTRLPGLVFPANAGLVMNPEKPIPLSQKRYLLANPSAARFAEKGIYREFLRRLGLQPENIHSQFEGEADFIPWGDRWIFTFGPLKKPHWVFQLGLPPWRRVYGFRSSRKALPELKVKLEVSDVFILKLSQETFYHGDTVLCSWGPRREWLLAYGEGFKGESRVHLERDPHVLWISQKDAWRFAANSFQVIHQGRCILFMPAGISGDLREKIESKGVQTVPIDVSEFFEKGGGSVKCLIGDLGAWAPEETPDSTVSEFREKHDFESWNT